MSENQGPKWICHTCETVFESESDAQDHQQATREAARQTGAKPHHVKREQIPSEAIELPANGDLDELIPPGERLFRTPDVPSVGGKGDR